MPKNNSFDEELKAALPWEDRARWEMERLGWKTISNPVAGYGSDGGMDFIARKAGAMVTFNAKHMKRFTCDGKRVVHRETGEEYDELWLENKRAHDHSPLKADSFIIRFYDDEYFAVCMGNQLNSSMELDPRGYDIEKYTIPVGSLMFFKMGRTDGTHSSRKRMEQDEQEGQQVPIDQPGPGEDQERIARRPGQDGSHGLPQQEGVDRREPEATRLPGGRQGGGLQGRD